MGWHQVLLRSLVGSCSREFVYELVCFPGPWGFLPTEAGPLPVQGMEVNRASWPHLGVTSVFGVQLMGRAPTPGTTKPIEPLRRTHMPVAIHGGQ
jgi:hypothetical protein